MNRGTYAAGSGRRGSRSVRGAGLSLARRHDDHRRHNDGPDGVILASEKPHDARATKAGIGSSAIALRRSLKSGSAFGVATDRAFAFIGGKHGRWAHGPISLAQLRRGRSPGRRRVFQKRLANSFDERFNRAKPRLKGVTWDNGRRRIPADVFSSLGTDAEGIGHIHEVLIPRSRARGAGSSNTVERGNHMAWGKSTSSRAC